MREIQVPPVCADTLRRLWEYLDQELLESETESMRRHLEECPRCGPVARFERRLLERIAAVRPDPSEVAELRSRLTCALGIQLPESEQRNA